MPTVGHFEGGPTMRFRRDGESSYFSLRCDLLGQITPALLISQKKNYVNACCNRKSHYICAPVKNDRRHGKHVGSSLKYLILLPV
jgi:hypothetical protein